VKKYLEMKGVKFEEREGDPDSLEYQNHSAKFGFSVPLVVNTETNEGVTGNNFGRIREIAGV
jgi:hypothetical protein